MNNHNHNEPNQDEIPTVPYFKVPSMDTDEDETLPTFSFPNADSSVSS
jgi:hypothetical protein